MSKFCRHILWSVRHSLSFNLLSPGGPLSSHFMWKLYRVFIPARFQLLQSIGIIVFHQGDVWACILMFRGDWQIISQIAGRRVGVDVPTTSVRRWLLLITRVVKE